MLSNAEIKAVLSVLWYTHAIRNTYENRALDEDERFWKNNGGMFTNYSRYNSQKWKDMMGPDDPTVRGRRISHSSMIKQRRLFEESYREPIILALQLADRVREAVAKAIDKSGRSEDYDYHEEIGQQAWEKVAADPSVREQLAEIARDWCTVAASSVEPTR
ncbi:hypothetical protein [Bradyrhizobium sp. URHD0069]|uniref:hypothetical protein n=1 Tax=Bradyrhizobium sp. URHD0069 TaxID=1380355 RepID=UPI00049645E4|nr:hypothetical protein [Bradyrhizobium sp. URHD0069]